MSKYQVTITGKPVFVEPCTYYPSRELAEAAITRIQSEVPNLRDIPMSVVEASDTITVEFGKP